MTSPQSLLLMGTSGPDDDATGPNDLMGIPENASGDLRRFIATLAVNLIFAVCLIAAFTLIRVQVPMMYSRKAMTGLAATPLPPRFFDFYRSWLGWIPACLTVPPAERVRASGLDGLKLIDFSEFAIRTFTLIGVPATLVLCPLYYGWGGGVAAKNGEKLSQLSIANVESGSWVFWVAAVFTVYSVLVVEWMLLSSMETFIQQRMSWLRAMPCPRYNTILVEDIPLEYRHDSLVKAHIEQAFKGALLGDVSAATMVKHTEKLLALQEEWWALDMQLKEAKYRVSQLKRAEDEIVIAATGQHMKRKDEEVHKERERLLAKASIPWRELVEEGTLEEIYTDTAFVTFSNKRSAAIAVGSPFCVRKDQFRMTIPPDPADVLYSDFLSTPLRREFNSFFGKGLILVLFFTYIPLVSVLSVLCNVDFMRSKLPAVDDFFKERENLAEIIEANLGAYILIGVMSFVPTVLMHIFKAFFRLRANQWMQVTLQKYYFWYMVFFSVLVTTIDKGLWEYLWQTAYDPQQLYMALAVNVPRCSNFYMSFIVAHYVTHCLNLTRYSPTIKYLLYRLALNPPDAADKAEPEDQDYYGFGGRSARASLVFTIALMYSILSPMIVPVAMIEFALHHLVYSYLLVYAETRKPDLGGVFFVQQLVDVQWALLLFILTMFSILMIRARSNGPVILCFFCLFIAGEGYRRFVTFTWEVLPIMESDAKKDENLMLHREEDSHKSYVQAELRINDCEHW
eukprot:CAMPEP_0194488636 /NCGR_PEP_ID=MMETSP0253-20130528/8484_1 /TAXON_ID=2966 /ORGANISM="Noctiluca scintillans" /LENGTH=737 /DNA_ID=CAMNT_0039329027 /DNA_START=128 /DNA_END=2338 /DNA_ORIENTATION=+